jgi:hypothetical protein
MSAAVPWFELTSYLEQLIHRMIQFSRNSHFLLPVAMIGFTITGIAIELFSHWGYPDGGESHALDIVQLILISIL